MLRFRDSGTICFRRIPDHNMRKYVDPWWLEFRVAGLGFRAWGLGLRASCLNLCEKGVYEIWSNLLVSPSNNPYNTGRYNPLYNLLEGV